MSEQKQKKTIITIVGIHSVTVNYSSKIIIMIQRWCSCNYFIFTGNNIM